MMLMMMMMIMMMMIIRIIVPGPSEHSGALHPRDQQEPGHGGPGHHEDRLQGQGDQTQPGTRHSRLVD